jgi:hypothetical protein
MMVVRNARRRDWVRGGGVAALVGIVAFGAWAIGESAAQSPATALVPAFVYGEASGCEGLLLYTWNDARTEVLTIRIDAAAVPLPIGTTTIRLEREKARVQVQVEVTSEERSDLQICAATGRPSADRPVVWVAESGTLKVTKVRPTAAQVTPVSVSLENVVLRAPDGSQARSKRDIRFTAAVALAGPGA